MSTLKVVALSEVAHFLRGITFKPADVVELNTPGSVACMRTKNVQARIDLTDVWAVSEEFVKRADQILQCGDILVSSANSWNLVGKCSWIPELPYRSTFGGFVSVLRANQTLINSKYLYYWFSSKRTQTLLRSFGQKTTSISNLNLHRCLELELPLPPMEEQLRIAKILDHADSIQSKRSEALLKINSLVQSSFLEMFGDPATNPKRWDMGTIRDLVAEVKYGTAEKAHPSEGKFPVLRMNNITYEGNWKLDKEELKYVDLEPSDQEKYLVKDGDILFNRTNSKELVGKAAVYRDKRTMAYAGYLVRARANDKGHPDFISAFLNSKYGKATLMGMCKSIVGMANINAQELLGIPIYLPPHNIQEKFGLKMKAINAFKMKLNQGETCADELFQSVQQRAFNGEL